MAGRPWLEPPPIVLGPDSPVWADPDEPVEFVVSSGFSMPWIVNGPGVTYSTTSLADANDAAVSEAEAYNRRHPGKATAVTRVT